MHLLYSGYFCRGEYTFKNVFYTWHLNTIAYKVCNMNRLLSGDVFWQSEKALF